MLAPVSELLDVISEGSLFLFLVDKVINPTYREIILCLWVKWDYIIYLRADLTA